MATVIVSVNAGAGGGGGLATCEHFLESEKSGNCDSFVTGKNDCVNFDVANVTIGVDVKFEKGFNFGCRDTSPALLMTPSHHSLKN